MSAAQGIPAVHGREDVNGVGTVLLVVTDGRDDYLHATLTSARDNRLIDTVDRIVLVDDSGDPSRIRPLLRTLQDVCAGTRHDTPDGFTPRTLRFGEHRDTQLVCRTVTVHGPLPDTKRGFAGAVQTGWGHVGDNDRFVFHLEDDFTFNEPPDLSAMAAILDGNPCLAQVALQRQPVNDVERAAGGIIASWPDEYSEVVDDVGRVWCEHSLFFTTNPSLYRAGLTCRFRWPDGAHSEGRFSQVLRDAGFRFAFLGGKGDAPKVHHIGDHRTGTGY